MTHPCTGVILSGGLSTRFKGQNKALIRIGRQRILDRLYQVFCELFDEIILVTNQPLQFLDWNLTIVTDLFPTRSSLTGIHTGLFYMQNPYAFFSACDTPFLQRNLVETLIGQIEGNFDIILPQTTAGLEPLCAIYSKRCLEAAERHLKEKKFKIHSAFRNRRVKYIAQSLLRQMDPDLLSFFNINTPEDLARAEKIMARSKGHKARTQRATSL
jgi:molybdopterin-guanine dinucleotide biosynthesis protein A